MELTQHPRMQFSLISSRRIFSISGEYLQKTFRIRHFAQDEVYRLKSEQS